LFYFKFLGKDYLNTGPTDQASLEVVKQLKNSGIAQ
jgi:hypothetical protein